MGLLRPTLYYEASTEVNKPIEEAWAVLSDSSRVDEWLQDIKRMEPVSGTPGEKGAVTHIYIDQNGEEMMMTETITASNPPRYVAMTFGMDFMNMDYEMHLKEKDGKTVISTKSLIRGNDWVARSILAFMPGLMKEQEETNLENLKQLINRNTINYTTK